MRIKDVLAGKPAGAVATISPRATVRELLSMLAERNFGALIVSDDGKQMIGIVSERDVVRRLADGPEVLDDAVESIMTTDVHICEPNDSLDDLMRLMTDKRIRHVPVVVDGQLRGLVSIGDAVKTRIGELEFERDQLNRYVAGSGK
ncbi:MAG: CBS domain-containing protein [Nocardioidaceae bacterium]|nr:CBS domain-containing protein [Nocardioidaceae bacterium]